MGNTLTAARDVVTEGARYTFTASDDQEPWRYPRVNFAWELHSMQTELAIIRRITWFRVLCCLDQLARMLSHLEEIVARLIGILFRVWRLGIHLLMLIDEVGGRVVAKAGRGVPMLLELTERAREVTRF